MPVADQDPHLTNEGSGADHTNAQAELLAKARGQRRRAAGAMDAIIAATALVHDLAVWTQDDDFAVLADLEPALRVHRG